MWLGCLFCVASPIGGAFSRTVSKLSSNNLVSTNALTYNIKPTQLVICLGPMYGIGAGMLFAPTMSYIVEWFDKRKSLAYGFM